MKNEEFYAQALLVALPIANAEIPPSKSKSREGIASLAHEYAAALTNAFKRNRKTFSEES
jgi:hypothetical protein